MQVFFYVGGGGGVIKTNLFDDLNKKLLEYRKWYDFFRGENLLSSLLLFIFSLSQQLLD